VALSACPFGSGRQVTVHAFSAGRLAANTAPRVAAAAEAALRRALRKGGGGGGVPPILVETEVLAPGRAVGECCSPRGAPAHCCI
jgi:hypothetical protein